MIASCGRQQNQPVAEGSAQGEFLNLLTSDTSFDSRGLPPATRRANLEGQREGLDGVFGAERALLDGPSLSVIRSALGFLGNNVFFTSAACAGATATVGAHVLLSSVLTAYPYASVAWPELLPPLIPILLTTAAADWLRGPVSQETR